MDYNIGSASIG